MNQKAAYFIGLDRISEDLHMASNAQNIVLLRGGRHPKPAAAAFSVPDDCRSSIQQLFQAKLLKGRLTLVGSATVMGQPASWQVL